ncbi:MAG: hypothetical protein OXG08_06895 [Gammaproteobacteria bacterium]|nr:hypothetical protein [Gammaproteobacteria bacterium]
MTSSEEPREPSRFLESLKTVAGRVITNVPRYFFELAIVFVGVYLAFQLTEFEDELEKRDIRVKFFDSLVAEFSMVIYYLGEEERNLLAHLSTVEKIRAGETPDIPIRPLYFVAPRTVVTAAFDSRNFESLNRQTIDGIIQGSPQLEALEQRIDAFNEQLVILASRQANTEECCYDPNGELLPHFEWYPTLVDEIHELNRAIRDSLANNAIPDLQELRRELAGPEK